MSAGYAPSITMVRFQSAKPPPKAREGAWCLSGPFSTRQMSSIGVGSAQRQAGANPRSRRCSCQSCGRFLESTTSRVGVSSMGCWPTMTLHPTVKPVALVADAIKDCSRRGDIVLDPFGGSGTTLIAAQKSGRRARLIEYDPDYCDVILRRYEATTGDRALLAENRQTFEDIGEQRIGRPNDTNNDRGEQNHELLGRDDGYESRSHVLAERARTGMTGPKPAPRPDDVIAEWEISEVRSRVRCCKSRRTLKTRFVVSGSSLNATSGN